MPSPIVSYRSNTSVGFYLARVHTSADERCTHHWPKEIDTMATRWPGFGLNLLERAREAVAICGHSYLCSCMLML